MLKDDLLERPLTSSPEVYRWMNVDDAFDTVESFQRKAIADAGMHVNIMQCVYLTPYSVLPHPSLMGWGGGGWMGEGLGWGRGFTSFLVL